MKLIDWMGYLLIGLLVFLTVSCDVPQDKILRRYITKLKARPVKPIEPIPEFKMPENFIYPENEIRRSPFIPIVDAHVPDTNRSKEPLEAFPLEVLKFVGVLKNGPIIWALVSQPGGLVRSVRPGNYIGKNDGKMVGITDKEITLEETVQTAGKWEKKLISIALGSMDSADKPRNVDICAG